MSTKSTIAYGEGFSLYHDEIPFSKDYEDYVWLELDEVEFQASSDRVTVRIPIAIWEHLRGFSGVDLNLVHKSDDEVRAESEAWVERHRKDHQADDGSKKSAWDALANLSPLGSPGSPRVEQLSRAIEHLMERREYERKVFAAIEKLKARE